MIPRKIVIILSLSFCLSVAAFAQLETTVHVWGEVKKPGEYRVLEGTNLLQLISKAGGPTEYANLGKVRLTHASKQPDRVIHINLSDYLEKDNFLPLPTLQTGDVVDVPRNTWYKWRTLIRIAADVAIIANAYYWFTRER